MELIAKDRKAELKQVSLDLGAERLSALKPEQYPAALEKLQAALK